MRLMFSMIHVVWYIHGTWRMCTWSFTFIHHTTGTSYIHTCIYLWFIFKTPSIYRSISSSNLSTHFCNIGASATQAKPGVLSSGQKFTPSLKDFAGPKNITNIKVGFTSTLQRTGVRAEDPYGPSIAKARQHSAANSSGEGDVLDSIHVHRVSGHRALLAVKVVINNSLLCDFRRVGTSASCPHATLWYTSLIFVRKYLGIWRGHRGHIHPFTSEHGHRVQQRGEAWSTTVVWWISNYGDLLPPALRTLPETNTVARVGKMFWLEV